MTILCLEDNDDIREMLASTLFEYGYQVTRAGSISHGMELAREKTFKLYLVDDTLEDGAGLDFCKLIRTSGDSAPIIYLANNSTTEAIEEAKRAGANVFLPKPVHLPALVAEVARILMPELWPGRWHCINRIWPSHGEIPGSTAQVKSDEFK